MSSLAYNGTAPSNSTRRATADRAVAQRLDSGANDRLVHDSVRIHEDEHFAVRLASAGIAGRGNLAMSDADQ